LPHRSSSACAVIRGYLLPTTAIPPVTAATLARAAGGRRVKPAPFDYAAPSNLVAVKRQLHTTLIPRALIRREQALEPILGPLERHPKLDRGGVLSRAPDRQLIAVSLSDCAPRLDRGRCQAG
jgi:hypothetical protein